MRKVPLSVIVPVKNEASNLARCLRSIAWADQVFVVDSNSTDATGDIAREHGAEVVQFAFNGRWPKKKNWALENLPFQHPWILILDADEELLPDAEFEIEAIVSDPTHTVNGYWINRRFMFMGNWLRHAYYPNWNLRLFRKHNIQQILLRNQCSKKCGFAISDRSNVNQVQRGHFVLRIE